MSFTPSKDQWQADLRRLAELFEEKPSTTDPAETISTETISTETVPMAQSSDANSRPAVATRRQPSLLGRATRSLIIFCMGVAATLGWQSYGDTTREMIASSYPQFGQLVPQTVGVGTATEMPSPVSDSQELLKSILVNVAALRESVEQLSAEFVASQQHTASEIARLKGSEKDVVDRINPASPAAPARKPVVVPPQEPPVR